MLRFVKQRTRVAQARPATLATRLDNFREVTAEFDADLVSSWGSIEDFDKRRDVEWLPFDFSIRADDDVCEVATQIYDQ
eukprot:1804518-Alexandrium_andersonii.AAC.1